MAEFDKEKLQNIIKEVMAEYFSDTKTNKENTVYCPHCKTVFEYDNEDDTYNDYDGEYILCSYCYNPIRVESWEALKFPNSYYNFGNGAKITDEEITLTVKKGVKYLYNNPEESFWFNSTGDTIVIICRVEEEMAITIAKNYWELTLDKNNIKDIIRNYC